VPSLTFADLVRVAERDAVRARDSPSSKCSPATSGNLVADAPELTGEADSSSAAPGVVDSVQPSRGQDPRGSTRQAPALSLLEGDSAQQLRQ